jgi:hypothetical protein
MTDPNLPVQILKDEIERLGYLSDECERLRRCLERIAEYVRLGGETDGAHHKQWALAKIGLYCGVSLEDEGIEP